jgi:hypothetical protein
MAKNPYFKDYSGEQNIIEDLSIEIIKTMGREMFYIPREQYNGIAEFGEANYKYTKVFPIEMYIASVAGFEGEGDIISKFGLEVRDKVNLIVSRKRFDSEISERYDITRPREGDLIFFPLTKALFEINFVEHENPFYQAGKLYTYLLVCELTTINGDEFETGNTDIDAVEDEIKTSTYQMTLGNRVSDAGRYFDGEILFQVLGVTNGSYENATAEASLIRHNLEEKTLEVIGISGSFAYGSQTIKGTRSGTEYYVSGITGTNIVIPISPATNKTLGDNDIIEIDRNLTGIYDFTDVDPFSEGNY